MRQGTSLFLRNCLRELAWGCGFGALLTPAIVQSLSLDEISVRSHLGQPLEAVIPVSTASSESLDSACVSVVESRATSLPGIRGVRVHLDRASGQIVLRSTASVREPLSELTLRVRCEGVPALERAFLVVLDPPDAREESVSARADGTRAATTDSRLARVSADADTSAVVAVRPALNAVTQARVHSPAGLPSPRRAPHPIAVAPAVAIEPGSSYLVRPGDTLLGVSARVRGTSGSLWSLAAQILAHNPTAFAGGDPDRLLAGVEIVIPARGGEQSAPEAFAARASSASHEPAVLPARDPVTTPVVQGSALSAPLSSDSIEKVQLHLGFAQPAQTAPAGEPGVARPDVVTLEPTTGGDDVPSEDAASQPVAPDATAARAPLSDAQATQETAAAPPRQDAAVPSRSRWSWLTWIVSALGAVLAGGLMGGIILRAVLYRRRAAELNRRQSMRRASGLEHAIRLDHGIIVREHPAGAPLTVDASTQEIAAIRRLQTTAEPAAKPMPARELPLDELLVPDDAGLLDFATQAADDITLKIESPITALDLELPEVAELPLLPAAGELPNGILAAATQSEALADSRQYALDTDLMELAYREEKGSAPDPDTTVKLETPDAQEPRDARGSVAADASYHLEADPLEDTLLACERADESKVVRLWDQSDEEETAPTAAPRARASGEA